MRTLKSAGLRALITHEPVMAAALERCHRERQFAQSLANAAFDTVTNEFSIEHNAQKLLALYNELVCLRSPSPR